MIGLRCSAAFGTSFPSSSSRVSGCVLNALPENVDLQLIRQKPGVARNLPSSSIVSNSVLSCRHGFFSPFTHLFTPDTVRITVQRPALVGEGQTRISNS